MIIEWGGESLTRLARSPAFRYPAPMFRQLLGFGLAGACLLSVATVARADRVELKGGASVTGRIVVTKPDYVAVDLGYRVLTVPRTDIAHILTGSAGPSTITPSPAGTQAKPSALRTAPTGFYRAARPDTPERPMRDLVRQLGEAVVQVRTPSGLGSGFFINSEGYLITNFHVIQGETQISIEVFRQTDGLLQRDVYRQVRIVALNKFADLALLKVEDKGAPRFKAVTLGRADALAVGERVFAIGSPQGLERTVTAGIVSTKTRELEGTLYLQTTTQINPGNSGGPLFNLRGEVVGVTNMKLLFSEGLGFAIPVEQVRYFLDHRDAFAYDNDNPSNPYRYLPPPSRMAQPETGQNQ